MDSLQVGIASRALDRGQHCGDQLEHWEHGSLTTICVVDGLGHGAKAEAAAKTIVHCVSQHLHLPLEALFVVANEAARSTRGAAMGVVVIDSQKMSLTYAGVGNTRALVRESANGRSTALHGSYGIVGANYKKLNTTTRSFAANDLVFLYTDGLPNRLNIAMLARYHLRHPQELAEEVLKRWARTSDDAAVLVARMTEVA